MIVSQLRGQYQYLYFTIVVGVIALMSCGLTYFFPFRGADKNQEYEEVNRKMSTMKRTAMDESESEAEENLIIH